MLFRNGWKEINDRNPLIMNNPQAFILILINDDDLEISKHVGVQKHCCDIVRLLVIIKK